MFKCVDIANANTRPLMFGYLAPITTAFSWTNPKLQFK